MVDRDVDVLEIDSGTRMRPAEVELWSSRKITETVYLREGRHCDNKDEYNDTKPCWRMRERMKTVSVALVMCLNIGTDPPDAIKSSPCARKECWVEPKSMPPTKAMDTIGSRLQQQYERWQPRARYKTLLDPTVSLVKKLCGSLRRQAKGERILLHYNGHGVPRPTSNGEIWMFNKNFTQYIPMSVYDLVGWARRPAIFVFDCSAAGILLPHFKKMKDVQKQMDGRRNDQILESDKQRGGVDHQSDNRHQKKARRRQRHHHNQSSTRGDKYEEENNDRRRTQYKKESGNHNKIRRQNNSGNLKDTAQKYGLQSNHQNQGSKRKSDNTTNNRNNNKSSTRSSSSRGGSNNTTNNRNNNKSSSRSSSSRGGSNRHYRRGRSRECIILAACGANETLPVNPGVPADLFTSCLTTPIKMALHWFLSRNPLSIDIDPKLIDKIPGSLSDRKTPFGELNWIFTSITDTIAWNVLPLPLFQRLFRQDLLLASLFRNFLLAERIMGSLHCTPVSRPKLPSTAAHHLWQSWDLAVEQCLAQLSALLSPSPMTHRSLRGSLNTHYYRRRYSVGSNLSMYNGSSSHHQKKDMNKNIKNNKGFIDIEPKQKHQKKIKCTEEEKTSTAAGPPVEVSTSKNFDNENSKTSSESNSSTLNKQKSRNKELKLQKNSLQNDNNKSEPISKAAMAAFKHSSFFEEQLTAFQVWLRFGDVQNKVPEQLPIVLQVLLSQVHRVRALQLLAEFLDLGRWAVNLALSVGIHPYVLKLLLSPAVELRPILVFIWARIIDLDLSCQDDLLKNGGHMYFVSQLAQNSRHSSISGYDTGTGLLSVLGESPSKGDGHAFGISQRVMYGNSPKMSMDAISMIYAQRKWMAAYVLALLMHDNHVGQKQCLEARFHLVAGDNLTSNDSMLRQWLCLALAKQWHNYDDARWIATKDNTVDRLFPLLDDNVPEVRGAAALAVGELLGCNRPLKKSLDKLGVIDDIVGDIDNIDMVRADLLLVTKLLPLYNDCSLVPRREMLLAVARLVVDPRHSPYIQVVALALAEEKRRQRTEMQRIAMERSRRRVTDGENSRRPSEDVTDGWGQQILSRLQDDMGSMADTAAAYLAIWQVVRDMYRRDPAPLVQRIAATLVKHVNTEMVEKGTKYVRVSGSASADNLAFSPQRVEQSGKNKKKDASVKSGMKKVMSMDFTKLNQKRKDGETVMNKIRTQSLDKSRKIKIKIGQKTVDKSQTSDASTLSGNMDNSKRGNMDNSNHGNMDNSNGGNVDNSNGGNVDNSNGGNVNNRRKLQTPAEIEAESNRQMEVRRQVKTTLLELRLRSTIFEWSMARFGKSLLTPTSNGSDPISREGAALRYRRRRHAKVSSMCNATPEIKKFVQSAILDNESEMSSVLLFHPYETCLVVANVKDEIRLWNYDAGEKMGQFSNQNRGPSRVTSLLWVNPNDDSLLMVGSDDGMVRSWHHPCGDISLVSAFAAVPDLVPGKRGSGLVLEWQQEHGMLLATGNSTLLRMWDLETERCVCTVPTLTDNCVTSMTSWPNGATIAASCGDGSIRIIDKRSPSECAVTATMREHKHWVVNVHKQLGSDQHLISASVAGDVKLWDMRRSATSIQTIRAHKPGAPCTAFISHDYAPVLASGSHKQFIRVFKTDGETISTIRYHDGFLGQRIGPVACLAFHPNEMFLAAGATDSIISIYSSNKKS